MTIFLIIHVIVHFSFYGFFLRGSLTRWLTSSVAMLTGILIARFPYGAVLPSFAGIPFFSGLQFTIICTLIIVTVQSGAQYFLMRTIENLTWRRSILLLGSYWFFQVIGVAAAFFLKALLISP